MLIYLFMPVEEEGVVVGGKEVLLLEKELNTVCLAGEKQVDHMITLKKQNLRAALWRKLPKLMMLILQMY